MLELYVIRHGETVWNEKGLLQGKTDIELNENGRKAARELGKRLAGICFDRVYASPLKRARETAELILGAKQEEEEKTEQETEHKTETKAEEKTEPAPVIETDDRLMEISFGVEEGVHYSDWLKEDVPYRFFFTDPDKYRAPEGGEELSEVIDRTAEFLREKIEALAETGKSSGPVRVMLVAHGALNKGLMCALEGNTAENYWGRGLQKNCEADVFLFDGEKWTLKLP